MTQYHLEDLSVGTRFSTGSLTVTAEDNDKVSPLADVLHLEGRAVSKLPGGFLFDGFEFVMEAVTRDGRWPGPKAHAEIGAWFREWFQAHRAPMPSAEVSKDFYRQGVTGIEYLGMIRKMAAINFYIRGLNPGNILQGDSLALFKRQFHPESATAILANPPFGAERDQEAYPEVWAEYPRESETTILFVKLMLETLKPGGRCAVVVSEGFMTWDQNSARALRKALLDEADLKAIISLPQGVFVSKSGQGPKTSILYFEKPPKGAATRQVTRRVWFYKVTNDGYSMGTNRKEVPGCQFVEALDLFHRFVRRGEAPPESRHAFIVPAPWIRTLDPRVRERIRNETRAEITAKAEEDRAKLFATLETRVAAGKLTEAEMEERLSQHETLWENKLANETARRIDRAHLYSFNLANYRSHLTEEQREAWKSLLPRGVSDEGDTLEERWEKLKQAPPAKLAQMLSRLEPASALEVDLAKEILAGLPLNGGAQNGGIRALQDIITAEAKYPRVKLSELCDFRKGTFPTQATPPGPYPMVVTAQERKTSDRFDFEGPAVCIPLISSSGHGKASMIRIHYQEGQFACANLLFGLLAKQPGELDMKYLYHILSQRLERLFCPLMKGTANVSMRMEDAVQVEFPLPPLEEQQRLVAEIERLRAIVESAESFAANWRIEPIADGSQYERVPLGSLIEESLYGTSEKAEYRDTGVPVLRICNIAFCDFALDDLKRLDLPEYDLLKYKLQSDDFLIVRSNGNPALVGKCAVWPGGEENYVYASYLIRFRFKKDLVNPRYVMFFLMSDEGRSLLSPQQGGGTYNISATSFQAVPIPLPPLKIQNSLVEEWSEAFSTVQKVKALSSRANKKILDFLTRIWES